MQTKNAQHTPGPWSFDETWALVNGPNGEEIAAIHSAQGDNRRVHPHVAHLNARLIAAAPELLEAAKYAACPSCAHNRCQGLRAAIAKAEGR